MNKIQLNRHHVTDLQWINNKEKQIRQTIINKHNKKLNNLLSSISTKKSNNYNKNKNRIVPNNDDPNNEDNVINISEIKLINEQIKVLNKGLKFVPTPMNINYIEFITSTESSLYTTPELIKKAAINEITTYINKWKKPKISRLNLEEIR